MGSYISNTEEQQKAMLSELGLNSTDELFSIIPEEICLKRNLELPAALSEMELYSHMTDLASRNNCLDEYCSFLGAGAYDHYIPSVVGNLISRQEFYTAYTPYQPEISQGTLQAIFEYQTMICELTGMDISNASMYDGATALTEAAVMACRAVGRNTVLVANTVHPESRRVLKTYSRFNGINVLEINYNNGSLALDELESHLNDQIAAVILQSPNFFGIIEDVQEAAELAHKNKSLLIASVDPISLAILKSPGESGADIAVGEGQTLGNQLNFGGPYFGFIVATKQLMRKMPGRIVGETVDSQGKRAFVLTIQTREQHIRKEKATSNICSNQALNALAATIYLSVLGKKGLQELAGLCLQKAHYFRDCLIESGKFEPAFTAPFFREFAVKSSTPVGELNKKLLSDRIIGGYQLDRDYSELKDCWLLAVTEKRTRKEMDNFIAKAVKYCE